MGKRKIQGLKKHTDWYPYLNLEDLHPKYVKWVKGWGEKDQRLCHKLDGLRLPHDYGKFCSNLPYLGPAPVGGDKTAYQLCTGPLFSTRQGYRNMKQLSILYDNGNLHTEKNPLSSNALNSHEVDTVEARYERFLKYKRSEPVEIEDGVFISGEYAIDCFNIAAIKVVKYNGDIEIRKIKPCSDKYMKKLTEA